MPDWDWDWYEPDSGTEDVPLLLSKRSQQLALSALNKMDNRTSWLEVDDATWDDIESALAEAYEELMEQHATIPAMTPDISATWHRVANQAITANVETGIIWDTEVSAEGGQLHISGASKNFTIPTDGAGYYHISGTVWFPATAAIQVKTVRVYHNSTIIYTAAINILAAASVQFAYGDIFADGDEFQVSVHCAVAITIQGNTNGITAITAHRGVKI